MHFFDLNIPFLPEDAADSSNLGRKKARLKLVVKSMELGYCGVAYNRCIRGVMSDSDRCTIPLLPLSSLLKAAPTLSFAVRFHRDLLGVPVDSPFRQYKRLTVSVDSAAHAAALNSGNPVLKTYDLVAVRPLNQAAFDQACKVSEVDLITIDFSQKLPFRLKLPMVKAAIERGVYFEIMYSNLISDVNVRKQTIPSAKLLVDGTRGKNLIFSSAALNATELRGPNDVANLSSLLGLSMERAKAAISKNCRSLITNALRKKQYYKEAIRIERIPDAESSDSKGLWFGDWQSWDPISSGDGDLLLDDLAKCFSGAHGRPQKASVPGMPSDCTTKDQNHQTSSNPGHFLPLDASPFFLASALTGSSANANVISIHSSGIDVISPSDGLPSNDTKLKDQITEHADWLAVNDAVTVTPEVKKLEMTVACSEGPRISNSLEGVPVTMGMLRNDTPTTNYISDKEVNLVVLDNHMSLSSDAKHSISFAAYDGVLKETDKWEADLGAVGTPMDVSKPKDHVPFGQSLLLSDEGMNFVGATSIVDFPKLCNEDSERKQVDVLRTCDASIEEAQVPTEEQESKLLVSSDASMEEAQVPAEAQESKLLVSSACDARMEDASAAKKEREPDDSAASDILHGSAKNESQKSIEARVLFGDGFHLEKTSEKMDKTEKGNLVSPAYDDSLGEVLGANELQQPDTLLKHRKKASWHKANQGMMGITESFGCYYSMTRRHGKVSSCVAQWTIQAQAATSFSFQGLVKAAAFQEESPIVEKMSNEFECSLGFGVQEWADPSQVPCLYGLVAQW
ncbi:hypothetical protein ACLOJK_001610 [Asimina triloba]